MAALIYSFIMKTHEALNKDFALFILLSSLIISSLVIFPFGSSFSSSFQSFFLKSAKAQSPITLKDLVTYSRQSSFIKEFPVPFIERGLKGITTDSEGNAWFYHSTNKSSTIIKLDVAANKFTQYNVKGNTTVDNFIINLAGGQILYDNSRNVIWFTDARTNSIGKATLFDAHSVNQTFFPSSESAINIVVESGPVGISYSVISPDSTSILVILFPPCSGK
jgi:hypothetical protein